MDKTRILVVEDEMIVAEDIKGFLKYLGYVVSGIVSSGEESLKEVLELKPDLVMMDIVLPVMDGFKLVEEIRSRKPEHKIILMTGYYYEPKIKEKLERYNIPFFTKPADLDAIWEMIQKELVKQKSI